MSVQCGLSTAAVQLLQQTAKIALHCTSYVTSVPSLYTYPCIFSVISRCHMVVMNMVFIRVGWPVQQCGLDGSFYVMKIDDVGCQYWLMAAAQVITRKEAV